MFYGWVYCELSGCAQACCSGRGVTECGLRFAELRIYYVARDGLLRNTCTWFGKNFMELNGAKQG